MSNSDIPLFLADILHRHANVNAFTADWIDRLRSEIFDSRFPEKAILFRQQFADAIRQQSITPKDYEELTGEDFDTQGELNIWLNEMWHLIFGDLPAPPR